MLGIEFLFFLHKNLEHNIERHYETNLKINYYYQYILLKEDFFREKLQHCLTLSDTKLFFMELEDGYGMYDTVDSFWYLNYSTFNLFFSDALVDIPKCFKKTKSVKRLNNEIDLLKFNNYFMRKGLRYKSFTFLTKTLWSLLSELQTSNFRINKTFTSWRDLFVVFTSITFNQTYKTLSFKNEELITFGHKQDATLKNIEFNWGIRSLLFQHFQHFLPMFSFYIYKVDKKIFKNTRGKSGKYTFIWKYVAPYKRNFLVMHWILKELRVTQGRTLSDRLTSLLRTLILKPKQTWIWRVKKFSYNYVYRNCRRTLAESYRTVTK